MPMHFIIVGYIMQENCSPPSSWGDCFHKGNETTGESIVHKKII